MSFARGCACLSAVTLFAACSGAEVPRGGATGSSPSAATTSAARAHPPYESPARWEVHPYPPNFAADWMRLAGGGCLIIEYTGQRWITRPRRDGAVEPMVSEGGDPLFPEDLPAEPTEQAWPPPDNCSGDGRAAVDRAPEALLGLVRWRGAYGFVGDSGTLHVAKTPIGPFVRRIPPPEPLVRVRSTGGAVLAVTGTGRLLRYTDEAGYKPVDLGDVHAMDVVVAPAGRAVVLAAPEALFTTEDGGATFKRADAPSIGVQRVAYSANGSFLVEGVLTSLAWDPHQEPAFSATSERISEPQRFVSIRADRTGSASLVTSGRAALDGDRYWEVSIGDSGEWTLFRGKLDGAMTQVPLRDVPGRDETGNALIAARDKHVAIALLRWDGNGTRMDLRVSHDNGTTFGGGTSLAMSDLSPMGMAVSLDGAVLLTGTCLAQAEADADVDVDPWAEVPRCAGGPLVLRPDAAPAAPRSPVLDGPALAPAFSLDGRSAYFLVSAPGSETLSMYVSHDGGVSFEERSLDVDADDMRATFAIANETTITVSESGAVGMVLEASGDVSGTVYVTTDADGKNEQIGELPEPGAIAAGFGERVLAITRVRGGDTTESPLSESLDGGKTWQEAPAPRTLRENYYRRGDVVCGAAGCVIGDDLTRLGWGAGRDTSVPFEPATPDPPPRPLRATIACEPRAGSKWTRVESVADETIFPDESDAARGAAAWMVTTVDPDTGEISAVSASVPEAPGGESRVAKKRLLGPLPKDARWALAMRPQIEGISLARLALVGPKEMEHRAPWVGLRMKDLEIAWENLEEGSTGHGRIPDAGVFDRGSISLMGGRYAQLAMAMLSVSPKGMFVRGRGDNRETFFVDTTGKVRAFQYPEWPPEILGGSRLSSGDAVNVDGTFVANADVYSSLPTAPEILFLMRPPAPGAKPDTPWTPWATLLAPGGDYQQRRFSRTDWTYDGPHLAVWTQHSVADTPYAAAWMRRIQADGTLGAPQRVPTPYDLERAPRACTAAERKTLPRLRFALDSWGRAQLTGVRHAVLVHEDGGPAAPTPAPPITDSEGTDDPLPPSLVARLAKAKTSAEPAPIGDVAMLSTGLVLRGRGATACLDAVAASPPTDRSTAALIGGDLSYGWFFRAAPASLRPGPKGKVDDATLRARARTFEARPLVCRYAPDALVPPALLDANERR